MGGGDGGFEVDEAKVRGLEEVGYVGEEGVPAIVVGVGFVGSGGLNDGPVGNDVSGGGKGDAGDLAGVGGAEDLRFSMEMAPCGDGEAADEDSGGECGDYQPVTASGFADDVKPVFRGGHGRMFLGRFPFDFTELGRDQHTWTRTLKT